MKKKINCLLILLLIQFACKQNVINEQQRIYPNTKEFLEFQENAKIKYDEAYKIFNKFLEDENVQLKPELLFCENDNYFLDVSTNPLNDKMNRQGEFYIYKAITK